MNRLLAIALALACIIALVLSVDPKFLQWLLVRTWVLALAFAPGAMLVIACLGYGLGLNSLFRRNTMTGRLGLQERVTVTENFVLGLASGIGVMSTLALVAGMVALTPATSLLISTAGLGIGLHWLRRNLGWSKTELCDSHPAAGERGGISASSSGEVLTPFAWVVFVFAAILIGMTAMAPPLIFDVTEYHLGAWTSYFHDDGARLVPTPYNFYARFPFLIESIYFTGLSLTPGIDTAPKLFNGVCVFACVALAWCFAKRLGGGRTASAIAALLALAHPVMLDVSIDAMIDAPVALLVAGSFYAGFITLRLFDGVARGTEVYGTDQSELSRPDFFPAAYFTFVTVFLFGTALAAKYTVAQLYLLPWVLLIFAPLAWREFRNKSGRGLMWGCVIAAVPCVAWFGKNFTWYGNPLEPFFEHIFRPNDAAAIARENFYIESHFPQSPLSAQYWQTLLPRLHEFGWVMLAACGGWIFARNNRRALLRFVAIAVIAFLLWNTVRASENRFLLPLFIMTGAFATMGVEAIPHQVSRKAVYFILILFAATSSIKHGLRVNKSDVLTYLLDFGPTSRTTDFSEEPAAMPREKYMATNLGDLGRMINQVNRTLPADARLLLIYEARPYLFRPATEYNVVWDDSWLLNVIRPATNVDDAVALLRQRGITHVLINRQELLRYIQQYARRDQLLRLGVYPGDDPRLAWAATEHPEDLYPPFYRDRDWDRLRPLVHDLLTRLDERAVRRSGGENSNEAGASPAKPLDVILTPLSAL